MSKTDLIALTRKLVLFAILLATAYLLTLFAAANLGDWAQVYFRRHTNVPLGAAQPGGGSLLRFRELAGYRDVDVLIIGSSHAYRSFDTRIFGRNDLKTFNMGSLAQTPLNSYYLLRSHIDRLNPRLIIVEVYREMFSLDGFECLLDLTEKTPLSEDLWEMAWAIRTVRAVNALLVKHFELGSAPVQQRESDLSEHDTYIPGGYLEVAAGHKGYNEVTPHAIEIRQNQLRYLDRLVSLAKERGISIALIEQPIPQTTMQSILNAAEVEYVLGTFAREHGIVYLDFNRLMTLDDEQHFFDFHHLNQAGVELFNAELLRELQARGLLPESDTSAIRR